MIVALLLLMAYGLVGEAAHEWLGMGMFALFYYLIDVRGWRRWTLFFRVVGLNSITIYLAQRIVGFGRISDFFLGGIASKCPEAVAAVISSAGYVAVCWLFLYFLYRKNVFLKV